MKALALISGGLDSTLAAKVVQGQGVDVIGIKFVIPFYLRKKSLLPSIGIEIREVDIMQEFLGLLEDPRHGFGSEMNPCIDCKVLMLSRARELMPELGASFIVTGEVLGQRPMSQHRQALELIAKEAGLEGLVVRPLSARLLPETIPEKQGWLNRDTLLNFGGRGRKPQIALAHSFGIKGYAQPAGGCLLTEPQFANRLKELMAHKELSLENTEILKIGRHFRLADRAKLIVGRNEQENTALVSLARDNDYLFCPGDDIAGPTALARGCIDEQLMMLCSRIVCRYCDRDAGITEIILQVKKVSEGKQQCVSVSPLDEATLKHLRI